MTVEQNVLQPGGAAKVSETPVRHGTARPSLACRPAPRREGPPAAPEPGLELAVRPASLPVGLTRAWPLPLREPLLSCAPLTAAPTPGPCPAGNFSPTVTGS